MTRPMRSILLSTCVLISLATSLANAQSKVWATVLDNQLNTHYFYLSQSSSTNGITGYNDQGLPVGYTSSEILSIWIELNENLPEELSSADWHAAACIELTDGQIIAMVVEESPDPDIIMGVRLDSNLSASIPIDRVRMLTKVSNNNSPTPGLNLFDQNLQNDAIRLENDDLITGFVTSIGTSVEIETTASNGAGETRTYPIERVHSIFIQNPPVFTPGTYVLTSLRERLRVSDYRLDAEGELTLTLNDTIHSYQSSRLSIAGLIAVDHLRSGQHLIDLASTQDAQITPTGGLQWAPTPTLNTRLWIGSLRTRTRITSPVSMSWKLPEGALRFTMDIGSYSRPWTNNQVSILSTDSSGTDQILWTKRFDATESPREVIVMPLPLGSTRLTLHIDPAKNGPIQDQHFVGLPLLLVDSLPELQ